MSPVTYSSDPEFRRVGVRLMILSLVGAVRKLSVRYVVLMSLCSRFGCMSVIRVELLCALSISRGGWQVTKVHVCMLCHAYTFALSEHSPRIQLPC